MRLFPKASSEIVVGDGYVKRIVIPEEELGIDGSFIQEVSFNIGEKVPFHHHRFTKEVFFCLKGPAPFVINEEEIVLQEGDCLVCEPGDVHGNPVIANEFRILVLKIGHVPDDTVWYEC